MSTPPLKPLRPTPHNDRQKALEESLYTFSALRTLSHLPNSSKAQQYLERIQNDAGIKKVMRKYKWRVGVLQEMEPLGNTDMNSKTLGKNWNRGEKIEVRLRTDSYDGFRDYKTVRKTMAHELAHMVHDEHDRNFWDLCNKLEKEIDVGDWTTGGRALTNEVFYNPPEQEEVAEDRKWEGGSFKLGGGSSASSSGSTRTKRFINGKVVTIEKPPVPATPVEKEVLSMREKMARAAEERLKKLGGK